VYKNNALHYSPYIELINAYSIILIGYIPGFLLGHSTIVYSYLL